MTPLWQYVAMLCGHWVADFVCQSDWMATNKSKDNLALEAHVAAYSVAMLGFAIPIFVRDRVDLACVLVLIGLNGAAHFGTDYLTSRWTARLNAQDRRHDFFVVIGLDQLIHQITLAALITLVFWDRLTW